MPSFWKAIAALPGCFTVVCHRRTWLWCVADNLAHAYFGVPLDIDGTEDVDPSWLCRRHDAAVGREWGRKLPEVVE